MTNDIEYSLVFEQLINSSPIPAGSRYFQLFVDKAFADRAVGNVDL